MKKIVVLASLMLTASNAYAQETAVASAAPATTAQTQTTVTTTTVAQPTVSVAPVVTAAPAVVESQPTVIVEASPLSVSKAEEIRKAREKTEVETEQRIVEKLEQSRMEDEKRRQEAILGSFGGAKVEEKKEEVAAPVVAAPVVTAPVEKAPSLDDVRSAVREELKASVDVKKEEKKSETSYMGATLGMMDYGSADIETVGALGLTFGKIFEEKWAVEIGANYGNSYIDEGNFLYSKMEQWSVSVGTKVYFLTGRIRPSLGFLVAYVNRSYSDLQDGYGAYDGTEMASWAVDYGLTAGVDFAVSDRLSMGIDYRFMSNMTYEFDDEVLNTPSYRQAYGYVTPIEDRDYDFWGFSIKYLF